MMSDEESQVLNILDVMQGDSYSETISNILVLTHENQVLKDLLLRGFYQNPKREIHHKTNSLLDKLLNAGRKFNWKCEHNGCDKPSSYSHELSQGAVLSCLADNDHKAYILKRNLKNNSFEFIFDRIHIRDILNFSGYCDEHDQCLFKVLDQPGKDVDSEYVNLQALRMMRRHKLNYDIFLKLYIDMASELHLLIKEIKEVEQDVTEIQEVLDFFNKKIKYNEGLLKASCEFYNKILVGIQSGKYIIDYVKLPCYKLGWVFSHSFELISDKNSSSIFSFMFKVDIDGQPSLIHAWEKTVHISKYEDFNFDLDDVVKCILLNKEKLVFSLDFLKSINQIYLELFLLDEELYNNMSNPISLLLFKGIFIAELGDDAP